MTQNSTKTYQYLLDSLIVDGIAEVRTAYADPAEHHKRDGAIEGFEACRGKSPTEIVALWHDAEHECFQCRLQQNKLAYWRSRYKALQIEFVLNVVSAGLTNSGLPPLLGHLPTYRGMMKYAEIVGVRRDAEVLS